MSPRTSSTCVNKHVKTSQHLRFIPEPKPVLQWYPPFWKSSPWSHLCPLRLQHPPLLVFCPVADEKKWLFLRKCTRMFYLSKQVQTGTLTALSSANRSFITPIGLSSGQIILVKHPLGHPVVSLHRWNIEPPSCGLRSGWLEPNTEGLHAQRYLDES